MLKILASYDIINLSNSALAAGKAVSSYDFIENPKTIIVLRNQNLVRSFMEDQHRLKFDGAFLNDKVFDYYTGTCERSGAETTFEQLDTYLRMHGMRHFGRAKLCAKVFQQLEGLFSVKNLYKQVLYHKSYLRFRQQLQHLADGTFVEREERQQLVQFLNVVYLIEQTIKNEPLNFLDFCTQLRGRILGEHLSEFLTDLRLDISSEHVCFFKNFHHALRENPRIDVILKMPKCTVLKVKFLSDKKRVAMSLSNGLVLIYNTADFAVTKVIVNKMAIIDRLIVVDDKQLVTAGIDSKIRVWNMDTEKLVGKFEAHAYSTIHMVFDKESLFTYGYDMKLNKFRFKTRQLELSVVQDQQVTALKLLKSADEASPLKLATALLSGTVVLLDLNLTRLKWVQLKVVNEEIISLVNLSAADFMAFTKEGSIQVLSNQTLEEVR